MSTLTPIDLSGMDLSTPRSAATAFVGAGLVPVRLDHREKNPNRPEWQKQRPTLDDLAALFPTDRMNIGVLLGEPSRNLTDCDLDCPKAVRIAHQFLPHTEAVFGRAGKPDSHWLYQADALGCVSGKWVDVPDGEGKKHCLCELRSTGVQTVFPPSTHKDSGEPIVFSRQGIAQVVSADTLKVQMSKLAAACLLGRHWPRGARHDASLAVAGMLLRASWSEADAEHFVRAVADAAGDEEADDRVAAVRSTRAKLELGDPVTACTRLGELVGEGVIQKLCVWLGIRQADGSASPRPAQDRYRATPAGMVYVTFDAKGAPQPSPLTNFTARIVADITEDDGAEVTRCFALECVLQGRSHSISLPARDFTAMNWPLTELGASAVVEPGLGTRDRARAAIQHLSGHDIAVKTCYTHTGWRNLPGCGWLYLHAGGSIGPIGPVQNTLTDLQGALSRFSLPEPPIGEALVTAIQASLRVMDLAPDRVSVALYACMARAILGGSDMAVFLDGRTGVFKTELAALIQQHFGSTMNRLHLPASWSSTDNALEDLAFRAKDAVLVIDDFKPGNGSVEDNKLHAKAERVLRGQGNASGRQRMRSDTSVRPPRPPRGMILATGEELPRGHSLRSRLVICTLEPGDIDPKRLSACQRDAEAGHYGQVVAAYAQWMAARFEAVQARFKARVLVLRDSMAGVHRRTPANLAGLLAALEIFVEFAVEVTGEEALTRAEADALLNRAANALRDLATAQEEAEGESDPVSTYIRLLQSAISSGQSHLIGQDGTAPIAAEAWGWEYPPNRQDLEPKGMRIGWLDDDYVYLDPSAAFRVAQSMAVQGEGISITEQTLRKRLKERGLLFKLDPERGKLLARVSAQGARRSVLCMALSTLYEAAQSAPPAQDEVASPF